MRRFPERLEYLYDRFQSGTATPAERREWMKIVEEGKREDAIKALLDRTIATIELLPEIKLLQVDTAERLFSNILEQRTEQVPRYAKWRSLRNWTRWTAAAVIIALFFLSPGLRKKQDKKIQGTQKQTEADEAGRAVLELADGKVLPLNGRDSGEIARQGSSIIVNKNGQLSYIGPGQGAQVVNNAIRTPRSVRYNLVLADGTRVWLNAASSLVFPSSFPGPRRKVSVTGEAYFEVAKDPARPFIVEAKGINISVLGTSFNVMAYEEEDSIKATLTDGVIRTANGRDSVLLSPGQQAALGKYGGHWNISPANLSKVLAWRSDEFVFDHDAITGVMREVSRWYNVEVSFKGKGFDKIFFSGTLSRKEPVEHLMEILAADGRLKIIAQDKKTILVQCD